MATGSFKTDGLMVDSAAKTLRLVLNRGPLANAGMVGWGYGQE